MLFYPHVTVIGLLWWPRVHVFGLFRTTSCRSLSKPQCWISIKHREANIAFILHMYGKCHTYTYLSFTSFWCDIWTNVFGIYGYINSSFGSCCIILRLEKVLTPKSKNKLHKYKIVFIIYIKMLFVLKPYLRKYITFSKLSIIIMEDLPPNWRYLMAYKTLIIHIQCLKCHWPIEFLFKKLFWHWIKLIKWLSGEHQIYLIFHDRLLPSLKQYIQIKHN